MYGYFLRLKIENDRVNKLYTFVFFDEDNFKVVHTWVIGLKHFLELLPLSAQCICITSITNKSKKIRRNAFLRDTASQKRQSY